MTYQLRKLILTALSVVALGAFFNSFTSERRIHVSMPMHTNTWQVYAPISDEGTLTTSDIQLTKSDGQFNSLSKAVVVLVNFADQPITTTPEEWHDLVFSKESESVFGYYKEVSQGQWALIPASESDGTADDGIISVEVALNHPNNKSVLTDAVYTAVYEGIKHAADKVDLMALDSNGNQTIEAEELIWIVIFAGYEELYAKEGCPSSSGFSHEIKRFGRINNFVMTEFVQVGELYYDEYVKKTDQITTRGILTHEIGHILRLPDLYDTDYSSQGVGIFSLMGNGDKLFKVGGRLGDEPVDLDPWSKLYLGFSDPIVVSKAGTYEIHSNKWGAPDILVVPTQNKGEYFVVENRYLENRDKPLALFSKPGGVLIWHIDENQIFSRFYENIVNNDETHKGVDLEESSEAILGHSQMDAGERENLYEPFFLKSGQSTFDDKSIPNSHLYNGSSSGISIKVIADGYVTKVQIDFEK